MNGSLACRWILAVAILLILAVSARRSEGKMLEVYDEDSLVHLSTDIIEAEIVDPNGEKVAGPAVVKVSVVHKGGLKAGQTVPVDLALYQKPAPPISWKPLAKGERLMLFLLRWKEGCQPCPGGVMLVIGERLFDFSQQMNPGPYVANLPRDGVSVRSQGIEEFRKRIPEILRETQEWNALLEAKPDQLEVDRLMKLLAERAPRIGWGGRDHFCERICERLAETRDPAILSRALPLVPGRDSLTLMYGFSTPAGRDFLLARVTDASLPMPDRLRFSHALHSAGSNLQEGEGTQGYLTRIAKAARALKGEEPLGVSLVVSLGRSAASLYQNKPEALMSDLQGALTELASFHRERPSEALQFEIESALMHDAAAYEKLGAASGPLVSILRLADPAQAGKPAKGHLTFKYEYVSLLMPANAEVSPSVVLMNQATRRKHVVPSELRIRGRTTGGGTFSVSLPKDLPAGRYQIYLEVDGKDGIQSEGHFFMAEL